MNAEITDRQLSERLQALPSREKGRIVETLLRSFPPDELKAVERVLRRLQHPDVPEEVWEGFEDAEDGRLVDLDTALEEPYPSDKKK